MSDSKMVRLYLQDAIRSGRYGVGDRLPTERALADNLRVSRSAVRDAMAVLTQEGVITRRSGSGTYVSNVPHRKGAAKPESLIGFGPKEIMEARFAFEPRLARFAAVNATAADLDRLKEAADACDAATSFEAYEAADGEFHRAIALATRNPLMVMLYETMEREREAIIWGSMRRRFLTPARRVESRKEHRRILKEIENRHPEGAEAAVQAHLKLIMDAMLAA